MTEKVMQHRTPDSLAELKAVVAEITSGKAAIRLGGRAQRTLAAMVADPHQTALSPIGRLAEIHQVNASTLTRLSQRLGYSGFTEMQQLFREYLSEQGGFYSERAERLARADNQDPVNQLAQRICDEERRNISGMSQALDPKAIEKSAEIIANAPRVRIYGARQSASVAVLMSYALGMLRKDASLLDGQQQGVAHGLAQLSTGDALVLIGSAPYTRATVAAAQLTSGQGIRQIALTDSLASPLAATAEYSFITPTSGSFFSNCMASSVVLIEILLSEVARQLDRRAVAALNRHEALIKALNIGI